MISVGLVVMGKIGDDLRHDLGVGGAFPIFRLDSGGCHLEIVQVTKMITFGDLSH